MSDSYDILCGELSYVYTVEQGIRALDGDHALLWWIRETTGVVIDPIDVFSTDGHEAEVPCGCEFRIVFTVAQLGAPSPFRRGKHEVLQASIERTPCDEDHGYDLEGWDGGYVAVRHDPKRQVGVGIRRR